MMIAMDFGIFQIVFCFVVGLVWSVFYFVFKALMPVISVSHGRHWSSMVAERDEDGAIKVFSLWNLSFAASLTIVFALWMAGQPDSFVDQMIQYSWSYLVAQNILG